MNVANRKIYFRTISVLNKLDSRCGNATFRSSCNFQPKNKENNNNGYCKGKSLCKYVVGFAIGAGSVFVLSHLKSCCPFRKCSNDIPQIMTKPSSLNNNSEQSLSNVLSNCNPAVVCIRLHHGNSTVYEQSGFIIHSTGLILSTAIEPGIFDKITIKTYDGHTFEASVVQFDIVNGLCLIRMKTKTNLNLKSIDILSKSDEPTKVGDMLVSLGTKDSNNFNKFSVGYLKDQKKDTYNNICTSEMILQDNFSQGGPLVNMNGKVVGINRTQLTPEMRYQSSIPIEFGKMLLNNALYKSQFTQTSFMDNEVSRTKYEKSIYDE